MNSPRPLALALTLLLAPLAAAANGLIERTLSELQQLRQSAPKQPRAALIERQQLLRQPPISQVQLAPDGRWLLFQRRTEQRNEVWLQELASGHQRRVVAEARGLQAHWAGDSRRLWLADPQGLAVYTLDGAELRRLHRWDSRRQQRFWGVDRRAPGIALLREKVDRQGSWSHRLLSIDRHGRTQLLRETAQPLRGALLDDHGRLAFSVGYEGADYDSVVRRHDSSGGSEELLRCRGAEQCGLIGYREQGRELLLLHQAGHDRLSLWRWNPAGWQRLHQDPSATADASALLWHPQAQDWQAIAYQVDRLHWHGRDAGVNARLAAAQSALAGADLQIDSSADGEVWLLRGERADWRFPRYYLQPSASAPLQPLFPELDAAIPDQPTLAKVQPLHLRARDGRRLHGYLTLPSGHSPATLPLVALVHGGPFNRDRGRHDPLAQLLANRGLAVLQLNFRGSTGYGLDYLLAPQGDFGHGPLLTDLIDGLDFLLAQGIGDPARQAMVGHSFGGYASLLALSHFPGRFRVGVASAAPVDLEWDLRKLAAEGGSGLPVDGPPGDLLLRHYGLRFGDPQLSPKLAREAPLAQLPALSAPLLLWAGGEDDRVALTSLTRYATHARQLGKPISLLIDPQSGHNPEQPLAVEALFYLYELAAQRHLGGALQPPSPTLQAYLQRHLKLDQAGTAGNAAGTPAAYSSATPAVTTTAHR